jgi:hypothetical protein
MYVSFAASSTKVGHRAHGSRLLHRYVCRYGQAVYIVNK